MADGTAAAPRWPLSRLQCHPARHRTRDGGNPRCVDIARPAVARGVKVQVAAGKRQHPGAQMGEVVAFTRDLGDGFDVELPG